MGIIEEHIKYVKTDTRKVILVSPKVFVLRLNEIYTREGIQN